MNDVTLTPAAALAERVIEATRTAGHLDLAPARRASALTALESLGYPTTRDERWKYTRVARIQQLAPGIRSGGQPPLLLCCPSWTPTDWSSWTVSFAGGDSLQRQRNLPRSPVAGRGRLSRIASAPWSPITFPARNGLPRCRLPLPRRRRRVGSRRSHLDKPVLIHHHLSSGTHVAQPQHLMVLGKEAKR